MDYRILIKEEFFKRKKLDPQYSVRKFAKALELTPMHLSYVLRGERGISKRKAYRIAKVLGFSPFAAEAFRFMVSLQSGRSVSERQLAKQGLTRKHLASALAAFGQG